MYPLIVLVIVCLFSENLSKKLPDNINRCSRSDPEFMKCLQTNALDGLKKFKEGNKEFGIPPVEPFFVEKLDLGNTSSGSVSLHQVYTNLKLHGMTSSILRNFEADFNGDKCFWRFDALTPVQIMESDYEMKGQLLIFPINGHGKCNNTIFDMDNRHTMECEKYMKKGKSYMRVTKYHIELSPKSIHFDFENIVPGNEQLSNEIVKTINENGLAVFGDVREGFGSAFSQIWMSVINSVFSKVPEEDIFLP